ncbi:Piso0_004857 [Millerozyma farinosa CBS 7064]|uniref:Piso0_004857 protein n=1 Tax=Pichia sorbitophila (strain ATCC MYA-4447 / BCRC 22081 / CBS 7064 / NBRC 10061 / NRRL Y-12695) TaxID=559304 RepID=G8Y0L9_PICSO|nr:Piso0_004857 [Millerozyma farinosa CBS 7064]
MNSQVKVNNDDIKKLASRVKNIYKSKNQDGSGRRVLISLAGVPGSGKSKLSDQLVKELGDELRSVVVPQDGFHLYRRELEQMNNAPDAIRRRGAPFTFNASRFVELIKQLAAPRSSTAVIRAPSFDHKLKDPVENDIIVAPEVKAVIIEGNYVSLKDPVWTDIEKYMDETWFIYTDLDTTCQRLANRHLEAGIVSSEDEAIKRAKGSDYDNSLYILSHSKCTDVCIMTK